MLNILSKLRESNPKEKWVELKGFESRYLISDTGRIFGLEKIVRCKAGAKRRMFGRMLNPTFNATGYLRIEIGRDRKFKTRTIHRLVAENFIPRIDGKTWVNHKNGCKTDNRVKNLEWSTPAENNQHAQDTGLNHARYSIKQKIAARKNGIKSRLVSINVSRKIRIARRKYGYGGYRLAKMFLTTKGVVDSILYRNRYSR